MWKHVANALERFAFFVQYCHKLFDTPTFDIQWRHKDSFFRAHSEEAVIAHACHGHTRQLSTGQSVVDRKVVVCSNPVKG